MFVCLRFKKHNEPRPSSIAYLRLFFNSPTFPYLSSLSLFIFRKYRVGERAGTVAERARVPVCLCVSMCPYMCACVRASVRQTERERANRKREGEREKGGAEGAEENSTSSTVEFQEGWRRESRPCVSVSLYVYALTCAHVWVAESEGEGSWEGGAATVGRHLP